MAYQALYRKYRPSTFDDFIDQDSVKQILVNSIINNKISHAYLFSGPRGIGKTSMAKIFAKAINCIDFDKKLNHLQWRLAPWCGSDTDLLGQGLYLCA